MRQLVENEHIYVTTKTKRMSPKYFEKYAHM